MFFALRQILQRVHVHEGVRREEAPNSGWLSEWFPTALDHNALNICLFPPLFFFYALYYTDVLSVAILLDVYFSFQSQRRVRLFVGCLISLSFRQTNVFWAAIFFGGLDLARNLKKGHPGIEFPDNPDFLDVIKGSWQRSCLYDPTLRNAHFEGLINMPTLQCFAN